MKKWDENEWKWMKMKVDYKEMKRIIGDEKGMTKMGWKMRRKLLK